MSTRKLIRDNVVTVLTGPLHLHGAVLLGPDTISSPSVVTQ